jgi:hypothetical protein
MAVYVNTGYFIEHFTAAKKARHDIRQRQGRRARRQRPDFQARQFLQRDSRIGLEELTGRPRSRGLRRKC